MAQSERSKTVATQFGWINYQKLILGVPEDRVSTDPPVEFREIFLIGYALGEERGRKGLKGGNT